MKKNKLDFLFIPLIHQRNRSDIVGISENREIPFSRSNLLLSSEDWSTLIGGILSPFIQLDSSDINIVRLSERILEQEFSYASHLQISAILCQHPSEKPFNYASNLNRMVKLYPAMKIIVKLRLSSNIGIKILFLIDSWYSWNIIRNTSHSMLEIALELTEDLDISWGKWLSEPVSYIIIPLSIFITNYNGFYVLSKQHERLLNIFLERNVQIIFQGNFKTENQYLPYIQYLSYLKQHLPPLSPIEKFINPYKNVIQIPLQPLRDNLENSTYEVFEKDTMKYELYKFAVRETLINNQHIKVVMLLGAGRGGILRSILEANSELDRDIKIIAVEKNINAVNTLRSLQIEMKWNNVEIMHKDMRYFSSPYKVDLIVSELLGSFGDNELSPECLYGAENQLSNSNLISIPCNSTSYIEPIMSECIYREIYKLQDDKLYETPLVINIDRYIQLSNIEDVFSFEHPENNKNTSFDRYKVIEFNIKSDGIVHGFAGYFSSKLSDSFRLSIHPDMKTEDMFSWFPIYFPLKSPITVLENDLLTFAIWRKSDDYRVWYEWSVFTPIQVEVHNVCGKCYSISK